MDAKHQEMVAKFKPNTKDTWKETMAFREMTEVHLEEGTMACQEMEARPEEEETSVDMKPEAAE
jgi:hypothetical protein